MKYPNLNFNIVLYCPEIPNNTGNIGRFCVGTHCRLHLIGPLGFDISDRAVKRSGLDYWPRLELAVYESYKDFVHQLPSDARCFYFSKKAQRSLYDIEFQPGDYLVFGPESTGFPQSILETYSTDLVGIPFPGDIRSFNLSNAVAIATMEAYRQNHK